MSNPSNLEDLRNSGWASRPIKQEIRENFLGALQNGDELFPGIIGFEDSAVPHLETALLAGQAKSRLIRHLVSLLDEEIR